MANVAIQNRWDCQAYWHYDDAEFTLVEGSDPPYYRLVKWPDIKDGKLLTPASNETAKRSYNHCVEVNPGNVSVNLTSGATYTSGAFTIYVASEGQFANNTTQGVITWGGAALRYVNNVLVGTCGSATVTAGSSADPVMSNVIAYTNAPYWPESHKLYVNGTQTGAAEASSPSAALASAAVQLFPLYQPRIYKAIALFNNYHTPQEVAAISAALLSRGTVPEPERPTVLPPADGLWLNFDMEVEPVTTAYSWLDLTVATPDYCTYPTGDPL